MSSGEESSRKSKTKGKVEREKRVSTTVYVKESSPKIPNEKRKDFLSWDDYFMATAFLAAQRSKDPCTQVGACIVSPDNKIVGVGYNGFPKGCNDDEFPWGKDAPSKLDRKGFYVCHAEANAILNKNIGDTKNCRMFVALFPCNECAKIIIQSGITEVIYMSNKNIHKEKVKASIKMFDASGIKYKQFIPQKRKVVIDFDQIGSSLNSSDFIEK